MMRDVYKLVPVLSYAIVAIINKNSPQRVSNKSLSIETLLPSVTPPINVIFNIYKGKLQQISSHTFIYLFLFITLIIG